MARQGSTGAPSSISEGLTNISGAINQAMLAPDAQPYLQLLQGLQQAVLGAVHGGQKGPPQPRQPGQGGTNLGQMQGQPPGPPSAGPQGGMSTSGISGDDMRRLASQQAGMAQ